MNNLGITGTWYNKSKFCLLFLRSNLLYFDLKIKGVVMYAANTNLKYSPGNKFFVSLFFT